nr:DNA adenine methylase [uncultured Lachnoclostridium sp.]
MVYQGSKNRISKFLVPIIQKYIDDNNIKTYIEPMCGSCSIIEKIKCENKIASDINDELIALLQYVKSDPSISIAPDDCSFEHYAEVRENRKQCTDKYSKAYTALIGYCGSYGGRYFDGGYGRDKTGKRNIYQERIKNLKEDSALLQDIKFMCCDYKNFANYKDCLFYMDPPYKNTKQYSIQNINYDEFYDFLRQLSQNNIVLVSEYNMPDDFKCIWQKERKVLQKSDRIVGEKTIEKLFTYKN